MARTTRRPTFAWLSRPVLIWMVLIGLVLLAGVLSAVFSILAVSPSNPIP